MSNWIANLNRSFWEVIRKRRFRKLTPALNFRRVVLEEKEGGLTRRHFLPGMAGAVVGFLASRMGVHAAWVGRLQNRLDDTPCQRRMSLDERPDIEAAFAPHTNSHTNQTTGHHNYTDSTFGHTNVEPRHLDSHMNIPDPPPKPSPPPHRDGEEPTQ